MSEEDDPKARLLDFLTDNIAGRERDAVMRAFYEYAEGDPHSHPVGMAVLLIACARQMARLPENVRSGVTDFQTLLNKLTQVDQDLAAKIANQQLQWKNNLDSAIYQFVGSFHGETSRTVAALEELNSQADELWKAAVQRLEKAQEETEQAGRQLVPIVDSARQIARGFAGLRVELKIHEASEQITRDEIESLKIIHQENQQQGRDTQALMKALTKEARGNWITMGYLTGIFLAALFYRMPWWGTWISFGLILGLLQWLSRFGWKFNPMGSHFLAVLRRSAKP